MKSKDEIFTAQMPIPDEITDEEMKFIQKWQLVPISVAMDATDKIVSAFMAEEKKRRNRARYIGVGLGICSAPLAFQIATGLVGTSILTFVIAIPMAIAAFVIMDKTFEETAKLIFSFKKKSKVLPANKVEETKEESKPEDK